MFFMFASIWNCWLTTHASCFATYRPEAHVIEEITSVIWKSLNQELLHVEKNLVGMDRQRVSFSSSSSSIGPSEFHPHGFWKIVFPNITLHIILLIFIFFNNFDSSIFQVVLILQIFIISIFFLGSKIPFFNKILQSSSFYGEQFSHLLCF